MRILAFLLFLSCLTGGFRAAESLIPPVGPKWEPARNVQASAKFSIDDRDGLKILHVVQDSDEGYTTYRTYATLPPGEYTLKTTARGRSEKGLLLTCYSFDKAGKPTTLFFSGAPGGAFGPEDIYITFDVPEGSESIRIDLGISGNRGEAEFWNPEVLKGKIKPAERQKTGFAAIPGANGWEAQWIWFEDDKGVPAMDFHREFDLEAEPEAAICEITADNGYELVVNGRSVGSDVDWKSVEVFDLTPYLAKGRNTVLVHVRNTDGPAGLIFQAVIMDAEGRGTTIATDGDWKVTHVDGTEARILAFGKNSTVSGSSWAPTPFIRIIPPRALPVKPVDATRDIRAGDMLVFQFPLPPELDDEAQTEFPGLKVKYMDVETGEDTGLSGVPLFSRCVFGGQHKTLWVEQLTSPFANPGTYRVEFSGEDFVIHAGEVTVRPGNPPEGCGARMPRPSLRNVFDNGNYRQSLYVFSAATPSRENFTSWSQVGGHFYELGASTGSWSTPCSSRLISTRGGETWNS